MAIVRNQPEQGRMNAGEMEMLRLLRTLPDEYTVLCELAIDVAETGGPYAERRPDFIVIGPRIGVVGIEVKDWNLDHNTYEVVDQNWFSKKGATERITSPWKQARDYELGIRKLLEHTRVWTSCFVAFPKLTRSRFKNGISGPSVNIANMQAVIDGSRTIFKDDIDGVTDGLVGLLRKMVAAQKPSDRSTGDEEALARAEYQLLPRHLLVGSPDAGRADARARIKLLSERQRVEVEALEESHRFLLDLAGSGKTNIVLSRALFLAERAEQSGRPYRVLVLTFSEKLAESLKLMMARKRGELGPSKSIDILSVEDLLNALVRAAYGDSSSSSTPVSDSRLPIERRVECLWDWIESLDVAELERFRIYDAVLVDEIQDLGPIADGINEVVNKGREYLRVGDVAQRIYAAELRLPAASREQVGADYVMYRCPKQVAAFADRFAKLSPELLGELTRHGYQSPKFNGAEHGHPEIEGVSSRKDELERVVSIVKDEATRIPFEQILVVTSELGVSSVVDALHAHGVPVTDQTTNADAVLVVDFPSSKGLERETVIVTRIEDLPCTAPGGPFATQSENLQAESLAMRNVYVALTRSHQRLVVLVQDELNPLVQRIRHAQRA